MKNFFKKSVLIASLWLFLASFLFAQNPTSDFHYYYYSGSEKSAGSVLSGTSKRSTFEEKQEYNGYVYSGSGKIVWVVQYNSPLPPLELDIKSTLKNCQSTARSMESRLDREFGDIDLWYLFLDSDGEAICSARVD